MLFAGVNTEWVFYGSFNNEDSVRKIIATLSRRHNYTRYNVIAMSEPQGQGIQWS